MHGQPEDDQVGRDGERGVGVPVCRDADAGAGDGLIPSSRNRVALPYRRGSCSDHVEKNDG